MDKFDRKERAHYTKQLATITNRTTRWKREQRLVAPDVIREPIEGAMFKLKNLLHLLTTMGTGKRTLRSFATICGTCYRAPAEFRSGNSALQMIIRFSPLIFLSRTRDVGAKDVGSIRK